MVSRARHREARPCATCQGHTLPTPTLAPWSVTMGTVQDKAGKAQGCEAEGWAASQLQQGPRAEV